jgi:hypothetical protein
MTTPGSSAPLPPALLAREQEAQVLADEANARKAAADAATSALTLAQTKYKSLVPDLTGVATNAVTDKSAGVAFSGLVTYSALNHAAEIVASRIAAVLTGRQPAGLISRTGPHQSRQQTVLVTSQSDLLTSDLLSSTVASGLRQLVAFADGVLVDSAIFAPADEVLIEWEESGAPAAEAADRRQVTTFYAEASRAEALFSLRSSSGIGIAAGAAATAGLGPFGLAGAAAAAIPSIISLFSSTTAVKSSTADISDLATTTSVMAAVADALDGYRVVHEDFRLAPEKSQIRDTYQDLAGRRASLVFRQEQVQAAKAEADLQLSRAQAQQDAAGKAPRAAAAEAQPAQPDGAALTEQVRQATRASADAAAMVSVISGAIASIDAFTTAVNATSAGARSPLATASLNELLHQRNVDDSDGDGIDYVLLVKGLGGQSEEYTKDRRVGFDTYTTLADASVAFMLYDLAERKIIKSGIANGVSSVHGRLGEPPTGLIGPNAADAIDDQAADTPSENQSGQPPGPRKHRWRPWF